MNKAGRPKKFSSPEKMQKAINDYFVKCDNRKIDYITKQGDVIKIKKQRPYTITGLCLHLGINRSTLFRYQKKEEFCNTITRAKLRIENDVEEGSLEGRYNSKSATFNLKNNFSKNWKDSQEIKYEGDMIIELEWEE